VELEVGMEERYVRVGIGGTNLVDATVGRKDFD